MRSFVRSSSLFGVCYPGGVLIGSDTQLNYGNLNKESATRIFPLSNTCLVGMAGEHADIQYLTRFLKVQQEKEKLEVKGYHKLLQRVMYEYRSKNKPLNVTLFVGGLTRNGDEPHHFLGSVNYLGNFFYSESMAYGIGAHIITPFLRAQKIGSREEAIKIAEECIKILNYRSTECSDVLHYGIVEDHYLKMEEPYRVQVPWEIGRDSTE